ncbi:MAG: lipopolysaccharide biosynthesis protein [Gemmatimonadaceae bacterium]
MEKPVNISSPSLDSELDAATTRANLDRTLVRGLAWTGAARAVTQLLAWVSTLVVVHLLSPADYGLVGMAALYLGLVRLISEFGLGSAVLVLRDLTDHQIRQLNAFSVLFGMSGFALSAAAAVPLGVFFHAPNLPAVVLVSSTSSIISAFRSVPSALLQRDMRFKDLSTIDAARAMVGTVAVLILASLGFGYWSLVLNEVMATLAATALSIWHRRVGFRWPQLGSLRTAMEFSRQVIISRVAWYSYSNSDFLVAGRVLGQAALGAYTLAWTLTNLPIEKVTTLVMSVTPTFFSRAQKSNAEIRRYLLALTEGLATITFPVALGMALTADDFVRVVLGSGWIAAIGPLRLLALYTSVRSITPLVSQALTMTGRARHVMMNSIWSAAVLPLGFWIGSHWGGATGIAAAWVLVFPLLAFHLYRRLFRDIELSLGAYLRALLPAVGSCAVMAVGVLAARFMAANRVPLTVRFAAEVVAGASGYALLLMTVFRPRMLAFRDTLRVARG